MVSALARARVLSSPKYKSYCNNNNIGEKKTLPCSVLEPRGFIVSLNLTVFVSQFSVKYPSVQQAGLIIAASAGKTRHLLPPLIDFYLTEGN